MYSSSYRKSYCRRSNLVDITQTMLNRRCLKTADNIKEMLLTLISCSSFMLQKHNNRKRNQLMKGISNYMLNKALIKIFHAFI